MPKKIEETRLLTFGKAQPYSTLSADQLRSVRPPVMMISDFMAEGAVCGLTSYPGVGKTWLAMEIARAVILGDKMMGEFAVRNPGGVLFVGSDSSEADYSRQWCRLTQEKHEEWEQSFDVEAGDAIPPSPFKAIHFLIQSPFMLDNADEVRRVILTALDETRFPRPKSIIDGEVVTAHRGGCALIVMDTLSRLTIANQNDNTEMERVFANVRMISEITGAAVLLLHHNAKATEYNDGADWRGAMSQIGALDAWVQLSCAKKNKHKIKVEFKKFRGITPDSFEYTQVVGDERKAKLTYLGKIDGSFFGKESIKDDLLLQFSAWKTLAVAEEAMWASYSDQFTDRAKFKKALQNRLKDLVDGDRLDKRIGPKTAAGRTPMEYQIRQTVAEAK